jgi:hypothetical protein
VVSGKIPTFIYYDAAGTELERVALDDKTAEDLSAVRAATRATPVQHRTVGGVTDLAGPMFVLCCWA